MIALAAKLVGPKVAPFMVWGLVAAIFAVLWFGWDRAALQRDVERSAKQEMATRLASSNASIDRLQAVIEANNEAARKRAEAYENSLRIARERANENERRATASNAMIARLEALAGQDGQCAIPESLLAELEGL